jgi:hypothetical protein
VNQPTPAGPLFPPLILRAEGAAILVLALYFFATSDPNWLLFVALIIAPDLALLGYLAGPRVGGQVYNFVHAYPLPLGLLAAGLTFAPALLPPALIWLAHIGGDRMLGFGLKLPGGFKETHLGPISR